MLCRRRELKVNVTKSKMMVLNGEEGLGYKVHVYGIRLVHVSEFKYFGCVHETLLVPVLMYGLYRWTISEDR